MLSWLLELAEVKPAQCRCVDIRAVDHCICAKQLIDYLADHRDAGEPWEFRGANETHQSLTINSSKGDLKVGGWACCLLPGWGIVMVSLALAEPTLYMTTAEALELATLRILSR